MEQKIEAFHLKKSFLTVGKKGKKTAVNDVSFCLEKGKVVGLIGTSGCGKTTILRLLMGLEKPDEGEIKISGKIGFVPQDPYASLNPRMTIQEIVEEPLRFSGRKKWYQKCEKEVEEALKTVQLSPETYKDRLPEKLSGGERQRVSIARALILEPDFLILDEPTSMLDQEVKMEIMQLIKKLSEKNIYGILMVTHDIRIAEQLCEDLMVMNAGRIVEEGGTEELLKNPKEEITRRLRDAAENLEQYWKVYGT